MTIKTPEWVKNAIFYQIFPDRFAKSDQVILPGVKWESWESQPTNYGFKGGNIPGIIEHLDHLEDIGVNAIYLNPVFASASNHRYHTYDYFNVDPFLGGNQALKELLVQSHARGMHVILDGVFNHASRGFWQFSHVLECGMGSPYVDWFHFNPKMLSGEKPWGVYPTQEMQNQIKQGAGSFDTLGYQAWWNLPALPKFNTTTPAVREFLWQTGEYWMQFGADGWRLDVPAEIDDDDFWMEFRRRVKKINPDAYIVGEIWHESQRWLQGNQFDAVMNYLLTGAIIGWLVGDSLPPYLYNIGDFGKYLHPLDARGFADRIDYLLGLYDPDINSVQLNLLDSHDTPRFLTIAGDDISILKLAWLFIFTFPGAPCIYYGDEIGMDGGADPGCRKGFVWNQSDWNQDLLHTVKTLTSLRKTHPAMRTGTYHRLFASERAYAFGRISISEKIVIAINGGTLTEKLDVSLQEMGFQNGSFSILFGDPETINLASNNINLVLRPRSGVVLSIK